MPRQKNETLTIRTTAENQLLSRWLAKRCAEWGKGKAEVRIARGKEPQ